MVDVLVEFDYTAEQVDELTIKVGEVVKNVVRSEGGWWEGELNGKKGMFPDNFVKVIKDPEKEKEDVKKQEPSKRFQKDGASVRELANKLKDGVGMGTAPQKRKEAKKYAKAEFAYDPENDDELKIEVGDVIEITKQDEEGWWEGNINGRTGVFPSNFVKILDEPEQESESTEDKEKGETTKVKKVIGVGLGNIFENGPIKLRSTGPMGSVKKPAGQTAVQEGKSGGGDTPVVATRNKKKAHLPIQPQPRVRPSSKPQPRARSLTALPYTSLSHTAAQTNLTAKCTVNDNCTSHNIIKKKSTYQPNLTEKTSAACLQPSSHWRQPSLLVGPVSLNAVSLDIFRKHQDSKLYTKITAEDNEFTSNFERSADLPSGDFNSDGLFHFVGSDIESNNFKHGKRSSAFKFNMQFSNQKKKNNVETNDNSQIQKSFSGTSNSNKMNVQLTSSEQKDITEACFCPEVSSVDALQSLTQDNAASSSTDKESLSAVDESGTENSSISSKIKRFSFLRKKSHKNEKSVDKGLSGNEKLLKLLSSSSAPKQEHSLSNSSDMSITRQETSFVESNLSSMASPRLYSTPIKEKKQKSLSKLLLQSVGKNSQKVQVEQGATRDVIDEQEDKLDPISPLHLTDSIMLTRRRLAACESPVIRVKKSKMSQSMHSQSSSQSGQGNIAKSSFPEESDDAKPSDLCLLDNSSLQTPGQESGSSAGQLQADTPKSTVEHPLSDSYFGSLNRAGQLSPFIKIIAKKYNLFQPNEHRLKQHPVERNGAIQHPDVTRSQTLPASLSMHSSFPEKVRSPSFDGTPQMPLSDDTANSDQSDGTGSSSSYLSLSNLRSPRSEKFERRNDNSSENLSSCSEGEEHQDDFLDESRGQSISCYTTVCESRDATQDQLLSQSPDWAKNVLAARPSIDERSQKFETSLSVQVDSSTVSIPGHDGHTAIKDSDAVNEFIELMLTRLKDELNHDNRYKPPQKCWSPRQCVVKNKADTTSAETHKTKSQSCGATYLQPDNLSLIQETTVYPIQGLKNQQTCTDNIDTDKISNEIELCSMRELNTIEVPIEKMNLCGSKVNSVHRKSQVCSSPTVRSPESSRTALKQKRSCCDVATSPLQQMMFFEPPVSVSESPDSGSSLNSYGVDMKKEMKYHNFASAVDQYLMESFPSNVEADISSSVEADASGSSGDIRTKFLQAYGSYEDIAGKNNGSETKMDDKRERANIVKFDLNSEIQTEKKKKKSFFKHWKSLYKNTRKLNPILKKISIKKREKSFDSQKRGERQEANESSTDPILSGTGFRNPFLQEYANDKGVNGIIYSAYSADILHPGSFPAKEHNSKQGDVRNNHDQVYRGVNIFKQDSYDYPHWGDGANGYACREIYPDSKHESERKQDKKDQGRQRVHYGERLKGKLPIKDSWQYRNEDPWDDTRFSSSINTFYIRSPQTPEDRPEEKSNQRRCGSPTRSELPQGIDLDKIATQFGVTSSLSSFSSDSSFPRYEYSNTEESDSSEREDRHFLEDWKCIRNSNQYCDVKGDENSKRCGHEDGFKRHSTLDWNPSLVTDRLGTPMSRDMEFTDPSEVSELDDMTEVNNFLTEALRPIDDFAVESFHSDIIPDSELMVQEGLRELSEMCPPNIMQRSHYSNGCSKIDEKDDFCGYFKDAEDAKQTAFRNSEDNFSFEKYKIGTNLGHKTSVSSLRTLAHSKESLDLSEDAVSQEERTLADKIASQSVYFADPLTQSKYYCLDNSDDDFNEQSNKNNSNTYESKGQQNQQKLTMETEKKLTSVKPFTDISNFATQREEKVFHCAFDGQEHPGFLQNSQSVNINVSVKLTREPTQTKGNNSVGRKTQRIGTNNCESDSSFEIDV